MPWVEEWNWTQKLQWTLGWCFRPEPALISPISVSATLENKTISKWQLLFALMLSSLYLARVLWTDDAEMNPQAHVVTSCESKAVVCLILGRNADVEWGEVVDPIQLLVFAERGPGLLGTVKGKTLIRHSYWEPISKLYSKCGIENIFFIRIKYRNESIFLLRCA